MHITKEKYLQNIDKKNARERKKLDRLSKRFVKYWSREVTHKINKASASQMLIEYDNYDNISYHNVGLKSFYRRDSLQAQDLLKALSEKYDFLEFWLKDYNLYLDEDFIIFWRVKLEHIEN